MSGILNVLGMAVAFAAFYIILVQVNYDLNFNKGIKDSEKVFVISSGDFVGIGERTLVFNRPLAEMIIETSPDIEYGGIMNISNTESSRYWLTGDEQRKDIDFFGFLFGVCYNRRRISLGGRYVLFNYRNISRRRW